MKQIILASVSPRRKQLLTLLGLEFKVIPSGVEEKLNPRFKPRRQTEFLSMKKAEAVGLRFPDAVVIAADTMVALGNDVMGKPKDQTDAQRMLKRLSGRKHSVFTGLTIIHNKARKVTTTSVETCVFFKKLTQKEIVNYLKSAKPMDCAGGYGIHGMGALFIEKIEGDFHAVMGLPLYALSRELKKFGIKII